MEKVLRCGMLIFAMTMTVRLFLFFLTNA